MVALTLNYSLPPDQSLVIPEYILASPEGLVFTEAGRAFYRGVFARFGFGFSEPMPKTVFADIVRKINRVRLAEWQQALGSIPDLRGPDQQLAAAIAAEDSEAVRRALTAEAEISRLEQAVAGSNVTVLGRHTQKP